MAPDVLFAAFQSVIAERAFDFGRDFTVADFMKTWTEQAGYPVITVRKVNDKFAVAQVRARSYVFAGGKINESRVAVFSALRKF